MYLVYCDEQDCEIDRYSAYVACIFDAAKVSEFKSFILDGLCRLLGVTVNKVVEFPIIHASSLPREWSDEEKIAVFSLFSEGIGKYCSAVYRVGYKWDYNVVTQRIFSPKKGVQVNARLASLTSLKHEIWQLQLKPMVFIAEFDHANRVDISRHANFTRDFSFSHQLSAAFGKQQLPELSEVIGFYYADKCDLMMYATDFAAYILKLRGRVERTDFQQRIVDALVPFGCIRNSIVSNQP